MNLYISLALIIVACISSPVVTQRWARQQQQQQQQQQRQPQAQSQYCVTPENYYGTCVTLSFCPQIANAFQVTNPRAAQQYVILSQRACNTRSVNGDPVVCCTRPLTSPVTPSRPPRQTEEPNIFFPTSAPPRATSANPFLPPVNTPPTTPTPVTRPTTNPPLPTPTTSKPTNSGIVVDNRSSYCRGPDTREGSCIPIKDCQSLVDELQIKQTDERFANFLRASNRICGNADTKVCCPTTPTGNTGVIPKRLYTEQDGCGVTLNSFKKIVGGTVSKKGAWPWIALIGYDDGLSSSPFKCGGTLITARHVITAAHCLRRDLAFVRLGEHDLTTDTETKHVDIPVVRTEKHPDYNPRNGHSDIAILYLARNVEFTDLIKPICMPASEELRKKSFVGYTPFVVGWGKTMEGGNSADVLQELQIPIYGNDLCRDRYKQQNRLFTENQFDSAIICAGVLSGGKDTCQGDSGGPLMAPEYFGQSQRYYLIGVVSYGIGCARPQVPGVYTSTQYFMDWIEEKIADTS